MHGHESLRGARGFEPLALALSAPNRNVRTFNPVIGALVHDMIDAQSSGVERGSICAIAVGHDRRRANAMLLQQFAYKPLRGLLVASGSKKDLKDLAFVIESAPKIHLTAANRNEHFVEMPFRSRPGPGCANPLCDLRPEPVDPAADRLIGDMDPSLRKDILDISETECEPQIKPDCALDDIGRKAKAAVADLAHPTR